MDLHVPPQMVWARRHVMTKGALVGALLRVDTLVALHMARTRRFVGAAGVFAVVVVYFSGWVNPYVFNQYGVQSTITKILLHRRRVWKRKIVKRVWRMGVMELRAWGTTSTAILDYQERIMTSSKGVSCRLLWLELAEGNLQAPEITERAFVGPRLYGSTNPHSCLFVSDWSQECTSIPELKIHSFLHIDAFIPFTSWKHRDL